MIEPIFNDDQTTLAWEAAPQCSAFLYDPLVVLMTKMMGKTIYTRCSNEGNRQCMFEGDEHHDL